MSAAVVVAALVYGLAGLAVNDDVRLLLIHACLLLPSYCLLIYAKSKASEELPFFYSPVRSPLLKMYSYRCLPVSHLC